MKIVTLILSGFFAGTGFLLGCVKSGLGHLLGWIIWVTHHGEDQAVLPSTTTSGATTSRPSSLAITEEVAAQQERARQQIEALRHRRALKN